ncbi:MAG: hemolysin activation protein [Bacteroidaceae bacterium]|nr:hemolysin activation protein [Bacteroidaceae bacterium]
MKPALVDVPVLILFFNRPEQLSQVFQQVREARPTKLFLYQDGPRDEHDLPGIMACREVVADIDWDCEVHQLYQERNYGCDPSEFMSQKWAFSQVDRCVVLEDDDVPSVDFFSFCRDMLERYRYDERVEMIAGFNVEEQTADVKEDYFFTSYFSIWGWASWRRVVEQWDEHYTWLDDQQAVSQIKQLISERRLRDDFLPMCRRHRAQGKAFYETIFWAHLLLSGSMCIVPRRNMINNLGATAGSTHFGSQLETLPRGYRRIFTMDRYELPERPLLHPPYMIEHVRYRQRAYRIMAYRHPCIKVARSLEELWLNLRRGNYRQILRAFWHRIGKWMGRKAYD